MTSRRNKMLSKLMLSATGETEEVLYKLTIERICADMCEFYGKFYNAIAIKNPSRMCSKKQFVVPNRSIRMKNHYF